MCVCVGGGGFQRSYCDTYYFLMSPQFCIGSHEVVVFGFFLQLIFTICARLFLMCTNNTNLLLYSHCLNIHWNCMFICYEHLISITIWNDNHNNPCSCSMKYWGTKNVSYHPDLWTLNSFDVCARFCHLINITLLNPLVVYHGTRYHGSMILLWFHSFPLMGTTHVVYYRISARNYNISK